MPYAIFCPSAHLVLAAATCSQCGWERPPAAEIGAPAFVSTQLNAGLGGPGRHVLAQGAAAQGVAAFPLNTREIIGIGVLDGQERWRIPLRSGQVARHLVADGKRFLITISDERPLGEAGPAELASLDPVSGQLTLLWQADGHQVSAPVLTENHIILRTSSSELLAFSRSQTPEIVWRVRMNTWWALPPFVAAGKVFVCDGIAMQNVGNLLAFDLQTGRQAWIQSVDGMLTQPLSASGNQLVFQNGRKQIKAVDLSDGAEAWKLDFERLYTPPVAADAGQVLWVSRGSADSSDPDHYRLSAYQGSDGSLIWQTALPKRVMIPPLCAAGSIFLASDDGRLFAYQTNKGRLLFERQLCSEEDPLRTELLLNEGTIFLGTSGGLLSATRVEKSPDTTTEDPLALLEHADYEQAAVAYALQKDYKNSARLYVEYLSENQKALRLYEYAGLYSEAAALASAKGFLAEAEKYYELAGDPLNQAEILLKRGDALSAARLFEKNGELRRAAELFEQVKDYMHALELYNRLQDSAAFDRVNASMPPSSQMVDLLLDRGKYGEAGETALKAGLLRRAVDIFKQAGLAGRELDALQLLQESEGEEWVFARIVVLGRQEGRFLQAARASEHLDDARETAEAYDRAARQAENLSPGALHEIGELYHQAEIYFGRAGVRAKKLESHERVIYFWRLPDILIESLPRNAFIEEEFNKLDLKIINAGNGIAREIRIQVFGTRFEVDGNSSDLQLEALAEQSSDTISIYIQPKTGQVGDTVPLTLAWQWQDAKGLPYQRQVSAELPVLRRGDTRPNNTPQNVYINTLIQGSQINGDNLNAGANKQVGDKVEVNRRKAPKAEADGAGAGSKPSEDRRARTCPKCKMPLAADALFCNECGLSLSV